MGRRVMITLAPVWSSRVGPSEGKIRGTSTKGLGETTQPKVLHCKVSVSPASESLTALSRPMPLVPPVIRIFFPVRLIAGSVRLCTTVAMSANVSTMKRIEGGHSRPGQEVIVVECFRSFGP